MLKEVLMRTRPLTWLAADTQQAIWIQRCHLSSIMIPMLKIIRIHYTLMWEIDTCDEWGIKRFQTRLRRVWNRFIPHESQVSIYHNQGVVDSLSHSPMNTNKGVLKVKTQGLTRLLGCPTVVIHIRKWHSNACIVMVTSWRLFVMQNKACHPLRFKPYRYIQKYQTHLHICRSMTSLCQGFLVVCVYMNINPINSNGQLSPLIGSVNCDVKKLSHA